PSGAVLWGPPGAGPDKMALTQDDVYRIAHLARIEIDAAEAADVHAKLTSIFGVLDAPAPLDTEGVAPVAELSRALAARELSSVELTGALVDRAERSQPALNAFVSIDRHGALTAA